MRAEDPLQSLRLEFKRVFTDYYREVYAPGIADPTAAFANAYLYLSLLLERLGPGEFMHRLDDETTHLVGQVEQDLRHKSRGTDGTPQLDELEDRLRECFEYALARLHDGGRLKRAPG
mgnify:CR=1 FL=1